jgi:hypothetical protein
VKRFLTVEAHKVMIKQVDGLTEAEEKAVNEALNNVDIVAWLTAGLQDRIDHDPTLRGLIIVESEQVE